MTKMQSALTGHITPGTYGTIKQGGAGICLQEISEVTLTQLAWFSDQEADFTAWLKTHLSAPLAPPGRSVQINSKSASGWLLRPEPGKLWLLALSGPLLNPARMAEYHGLDLTHGRCWISLSGPNSADVLRRMAALDFSNTAFPPGQFAGTAFDQVPVHLLRLEEGWLIGLPRSYMLSCYEMIRETSLQFGLQELAAKAAADWL